MKLMAKRDELRRLYDLADRKGYDVTQSTMRDHVRLVTCYAAEHFIRVFAVYLD
jgi:hypothetical protein